MNTPPTPRPWLDARRTADGFSEEEEPSSTAGPLGGAPRPAYPPSPPSPPSPPASPAPPAPTARHPPATEPTALAAGWTRRDGGASAGLRAPRPAGSQRVRRASVPVDGVTAAPPERGREVLGDRGATPEQRRAMWGQATDTVAIEDQTPTPKHRRVAAPGAARSSAELAAIASSEPWSADIPRGVQ